MNTSHPHRSAFTLVELLVVIGIIALLISILLPSLNAARRQAQSVACKSNLQQINLATQMYANDFRDHYPADGVAGTTYALMGNALYRRGFNSTGQDNLGSNPSFVPSALPEKMGLPAALDQMRYIKTGAGGHSVWVCPAAVDWMQDAGNTYQWSKLSWVQNSKSFDRKAGMSINFKINMSINPGAAWVRDNTNLYPATTGVVGPGSVIAASKVKEYFKHRSNRQNSINVLFADGHVGEGIYSSSVTFITADNVGNPSGDLLAIP